MPLVRLVTMLHDAFFGLLQRLLGEWFLGAAARFVFAAVLLLYFLGSATTKIGDGPLGFLFLSPGAYAQVIPPVFEAAGMNPAGVAWFWKLLVYFATYAEFVLPVLVVIGLFTRAAAFGMILFVLAQSYADWKWHGADAETLGAWFDRTASSLILDQRAFWIFLLAYLVLKGAGPLSVDRLIAGRGNAN
jgi:putative oxidoreductase